MAESAGWGEYGQAPSNWSPTKAQEAVISRPRLREIRDRGRGGNLNTDIQDPQQISMPVPAVRRMAQAEPLPGGEGTVGQTNDQDYISDPRGMTTAKTGLAAHQAAGPARA